jgi:hypothetical protein
MARNFFCRCCEDTGKVGIIFKKTCPTCEGDPVKYFHEHFPKPPPPKGSGGKSIYIDIDMGKQIQSSLGGLLNEVAEALENSNHTVHPVGAIGSEGAKGSVGVQGSVSLNVYASSSMSSPSHSAPMVPQVPQEPKQQAHPIFADGGRVLDLE